MKQGYLIGADIGTTQTKSFLFRTDGKLMAGAHRDYPSTHTRADRSEQSAEDWWYAFRETVREILQAIPDPQNVLALSLSTQGGTLVPVSEDGSPLRSAIVWNDGRCAEESLQLQRSCDAEYILQKTGWTPGNGLNALEILWLKNHEPELFARTHRFLSVPDYMSMKLTGRAALDYSNAGINQLADIQKKCWDEKILTAVGISKDRLGELVSSGDAVGTLTAQAARELGLEQSTLVVAGGHDQYCAALGAGAVHSGDVFIATGTCWVVAGISDRPDPRFSYSRHTVPGLWGSLISQEAGGGCLEWFRNNLGPDDGGPIDYGTLNRTLETLDTGELLFYPFFSGISYPAEQPEARAAFCNLSYCHNRYHMARAMMEGVCAQVAWMLEHFNTESLQSIKMVGGATNSPLWVQIMADTAGIPVVVPRIPDVGCIGAAILAGRAAGVFDSFPQGIKTLCQGETLISPDAQSARYRQKFSVYKRGFKKLFDCAV